MDNERQALPEGWEVVDLPEIVFFQEGPGVRKHQFATEGIKLLNVGNLVDNELILDNTDTYISKEEATTKYKHFLVDEGDLIIASSGIKVNYFHKKIAFAKRENLPLCMNTSTIRFKVLNKNQLSIKYFRYFLMTNFFTKQVQFHITGSAQLNFGPSHLEKMRVILPPIEIQNKIVLIFEKAEELKRLRAQADELTNKLLQSVFLEMFGDPVKNSKGWEVIKLQNLLNKPIMNGLYLSRDKYVKNGGIEMVHMSDAFYGIVKRGNLKQVNINKNEINKYNVDYNDILIARRSLNYEGSAKPCRIPNSNEPLVFESSLIKLSPDKNRVLPTYLYYYLNNEDVRKAYVFKYVTKSTISGINQSGLNRIDIIVPSLDIQQKFARVVEKVESMRQSQSQSKQQIEDLFSALMQKAFRGDL